MIYIASPYWHENSAIRQARTAHTLLIARALLRRKLPVFSPIVHGHALNECSISGNPNAGLSPDAPNLNFSHQDWLDLDFQYLRACSAMLILELDGWRQSKGVQMEQRYCYERGIPVSNMNYSACETIIQQEQALLGQTSAAMAD